MNLLGFWQVVRRYAVLLVISTALGAAAGGLLETAQPTAYVATIRLISSNQKADNTPVSQSPTLSVARMATYVQLVNSTLLTSRLVTSLGLPESPEALASRISASVDKDTVIMTVTIGAPSSSEARSIAQAIPTAYTGLINELSGVSAGSEYATVFRVFDGPFVTRTSSTLRLALAVFIGVVIGFALGMAAVLVRERGRIGRSPEGLSRLLGLPTVGIIPQSEGLHDEESEWVGGVDEAQRLACHRLARNLNLLSTKSRRTIVVTGPTHEARSAFIAVGLAAALAQRGRRTLLVDADFTSAAAAEALGVATTQVFLFGEAAKKSDVATSVKPVPGVGGLDVLVLSRRPGSSPSEGISRQVFHETIRAHQRDYELIVVSSAPVLARSDLPTALDIADAVLLVTDQTEEQLGDIVAATESMSATASSDIGLVMCGVKPGTIERSQYLAGVVRPAPSTM